MITNKDIEYAREREKLLSETYLKGIVDFMKWSSTLIIAAILWVSSNIISFVGLSWWLSIVSLVFFVVSLFVAIFAVKRVLTAWSREWDVAREDYNLSLFKKLKWFEESKQKLADSTRLAELNRKEREQIDRLINAIDSTKPFSEPKKFNAWVIWHVIPLVAGLLIYAIAQILSRF